MKLFILYQSAAEVIVVILFYFFKRDVKKWYLTVSSVSQQFISTHLTCYFVLGIHKQNDDSIDANYSEFKFAMSWTQHLMVREALPIYCHYTIVKSFRICMSAFMCEILPTPTVI